MCFVTYQAFFGRGGSVTLKSQLQIGKNVLEVTTPPLLDLSSSVVSLPLYHL